MASEIVEVKRKSQELLDLKNLGVNIQVRKDEGEDLLKYAVIINDRPIGGGVMTDEGLSVEDTLLKIATLTNAKRLAEVFV